MEDLLGQIGEELPPPQAREVYEVLFKILNNIIQNPAEAKFRTLKKENKVVADKLARSGGALSTLLAVGFDDQDATYHCPMGAGLDEMRTCVELLECMLASFAEENPAEPAATLAAVPVPAEGCTESPSAARPAAAARTAPPPNPRGFTRRSDTEAQRSGQANQLQAVRMAQQAQFVENPQGPTATSMGTVSSAKAEEDGAEAARKKAQPRSAFDFESRERKAAERQQADQSLEEMRRRQKEKFKEFKSDPRAGQQEAYQRPASVAGGAEQKGEAGWGGWFSGMFGGGSGSNSGGGGGGGGRRDDRRPGPTIKGIGDLPKPVQRGG